MPLFDSNNASNSKSSKTTLKNRHRTVSIDVFFIKLLLCHGEHHNSLYKHHYRPDATSDKADDYSEYARCDLAEIEVVYAQSSKENGKKSSTYTIFIRGFIKVGRT